MRSCEIYAFWTSGNLGDPLLLDHASHVFRKMLLSQMSPRVSSGAFFRIACLFHQNVILWLLTGELSDWSQKILILQTALQA